MSCDALFPSPTSALADFDAPEAPDIKWLGSVREIKGFSLTTSTYMPFTGASRCANRRVIGIAAGLGNRTGSIHSKQRLGNTQNLIEAYSGYTVGDFSLMLLPLQVHRDL